jgi:hypothetical protein
MLGLLRRRGGVTIERESEHEVGILVGTATGAPPWPTAPDRGRRVLVEATGGRWSGERRLREAGFQVAVCSGPTSRSPGDPCPLLVGEPCALVDGADVVVHLLPSDEPAHRGVAAALPTDGPEVLITPSDEGRVAVAEVLEALEALGDAPRVAGPPAR